MKTKEKVSVSHFLKNEIPFSVIQYNTWLKGCKSEINKCYEIIYLNEKKQRALKKLGEKGIFNFYKNVSKFNLVLNVSDGKVYEYLNFKQYLATNEVQVNTLKKKLPKTSLLL